MRPLLKIMFVTVMALTFLHPTLFINESYAGNITGAAPGAVGVPSISGYPPGAPGYSGVWNGLTTNTDMLITLDSAVAMVGTQPDMTYCVKKLKIDVATQGFDYSFTDVTCDAAASDDRKSVRLYPKALLDINSPYAYKVASLNFQGGGSAQNFSQCYLTGNNPVIPPGNSVAQASLCTDYNYSEFNLISGGNYCFKCHVNGYVRLNGTWDSNSYPIPTCP